MNRMIVIDEKRLIGQIDYLKGLTAIKQQQEDEKLEAINQLNRIFIMCEKGLTGLLLERSVLERELDWLDRTIARHDMLQSYDISEKYCARQNQITWLLTQASEDCHPTEITRNEIYQMEDIVPGSSSWFMKNEHPSKKSRLWKLTKDKTWVQQNLADDYPDFHIN